MSESENENAPRFNKAIIGRILAVLVFVALGTFAVIQSIKSKPPAVAQKPENSESDDKSEDDSSIQGTEKNSPSSSSPEKKLTNGLPTPNPATGPKSLQGKDFSPTAKSNPRSSGFPNESKPTNNSFARPSLPNKSFPMNQPTLPVVTAKPQSKPPERFAQAPGGPPILGSKNGFGTRTADAMTSANKIDNSKLDGMLRSSTEKAASTAGQLKTNIQKSADDLLKQTSQDAAASAKKVNSSLGSFGPKPNPSSGLPGPPPAKSFAPPTVKSDFGSRTTTRPNAGSTSLPSPKNDIRSPQSSSSINPKSTLPVTAKPDGSKFGPLPGPSNPSLQDFSSRQTPAKLPGAPGSTANQPRSPSSPFGSLDVRNSAPPKAPTAPLRTPPPANPAAKQLSNFPRPPSEPSKQAFPSNNNRPISRLAPSNSTTPSTTPSPPSDLAQASPGDRQLEGVQAAAVTVEKLSPREIQVDQAADFQLIIKNVGRADAADVRVFDRVPAGTEFLGSSPEPTSQSRTGEIQWNIGKLRPGQEKRIKLQLRPTRPGEIGSVADVTFSTQASMRTLVTKPVLEIVHQSKPTHLIGDDVILDVIVKNKGDGAAKNVLIQEDVPKQLEFQDGYRELEYEIGTLMPGQSRRVQLALKAAQVGKLRNVVFASASGGLQTKHELPMEIVAPKLVVRTDGPTRRFLQRNATHQFIVANNGTAPATNVELITRLPSGLRFLGANNQGRYDASAHSVYWSLAELARGVEAKVELKTMPVEVGNQPIKFESFADLKVKANAEQALSVEHLVDVFFDIDDVVDPIEIGSDTSYRIRVVNQGTKAATNVQLQVDFPTGLKPTSVDGSLRHNINGQRIVFEPINSLTPGAEISVVIRGKGQSAGDHRVVVNMRADGRQTPVSKEETTRVYSDR